MKIGESLRVRAKTSETIFDANGSLFMVSKFDAMVARMNQAIKSIDRILAMTASFSFRNRVIAPNTYAVNTQFD